MSQRAWIERRWTLDGPVDLAPALVERLRGTPARLEERLRGLDRDRLLAQVGDCWCIQVHAGHLLDLEALIWARLEDYRTGADVLTPADMENQATQEAEHDQRPLAELLAGFRAARGAVVARLDGLDPRDFGRTALHPRLEKPMRLVDLCLFHADHDDHHLARITELLRFDPSSTAGGGEE